MLVLNKKTEETFDWTYIIHHYVEDTTNVI